MTCIKCGHELNEGLKFCTKCGIEITNICKNNFVRKRHGFTTFWLFYKLITSIIGTLGFLSLLISIDNEILNHNEFFIVFILFLIYIIGFLLLLLWKKMGFWIFIGTSVINIIYCLIIVTDSINKLIDSIGIGSLGIIVAIILTLPTLIDLAIMWGVLHLRKNGKNTLEQLE